MNHCEGSLIPNPTPFERDLEAHAAQKYCRLDADIIRALQDPMACPVEFLPWLAYALSVDVWNERWPEATKRAVCANALEMHRHKGTHGGVMDALAALGVRPEIVYWHEMQPPGDPGTMDVTLWINTILNPAADMIIGAEAVRDILEQLNRSKRASIHYKFKLAAESTPVALSVGATGQVSTLQRSNATHDNTSASAAPVGIGIDLSGQITALLRTHATQIRTAATAAASHLAIGVTAQINALQRANAASVATAAQAVTSLSFGVTAQFSPLLRIEATL